MNEVFCPICEKEMKRIKYSFSHLECEFCGVWQSLTRQELFAVSHESGWTQKGFFTREELKRFAKLKGFQ
jgi:hypothetical protein